MAGDPRGRFYIYWYYRTFGLKSQTKQTIIFHMVIPQKFKQLRESRGLTTRGLAKDAGVSTETINAIEHGRRLPTVRTLEKLARALDVEVKEFFVKEFFS